jgi:hypothetical protein
MVSWPRRRRSDKSHLGKLGRNHRFACQAQAPSLRRRGASKFRPDVQPLHTRITTHPGQALYEMVVMARPCAHDDRVTVVTPYSNSHPVCLLASSVPRAPFICSARSPARLPRLDQAPRIEAHCRPIGAASDPHVDELHRCRCWDEIERHLVGDRLRRSKGWAHVMGADRPTGPSGAQTSGKQTRHFHVKS